MPAHANWSTVCYWEGPNGEYRFVLPVEPIIHKLQAIERSTERAVADVDAANEAAKAARLKELRSALVDYMTDLRERALGVRQTFGPGRIRRRNWLAMERGDTNHQRFLRARQGLS